MLNQYQDILSKAREARGKTSDFLSKLMQEHSISLDESLTQSQLQSHYQSQPQRNLDLLRTPLTTANRSPVPETHTQIQTPFSIQTSPKARQETTTQELSPRERFNTIRQNLLTTNNLTTVTGPREIERNLNTELLIAGESLSVYNNVDKMLEKIKSKREGWSVVDKLAVNLAQTEARSQAFNKIDHKFHLDDDVDALVETIKNATRKKFEPIKKPQPQKEFESPVKETSNTSPRPSTVNKGTQSPNQWEAPERDQPEVQKDHSPKRSTKDAEVNTSNLATKQPDSADRENNPNGANQIPKNYLKNKGILDNFADDFKSNRTESYEDESLASSRTIGNMSQAKSSQGSISFNISQSMINSPDLSKVMGEYNQENTPLDVPKKEINHPPPPKKELLPGKIPLAPVHTQSKEPKEPKEPRESKQSARTEESARAEKPTPREPEPSPPKIQEDEVLNYIHEEETFRAPIPQQQEEKPKVVQQKKTIDVKPRESKPKFMNSFKSRIAQLKNANPHRAHDEDEEQAQEAPKPRPNLQIETTTQPTSQKKIHKNKENNSNDNEQVHSPVSLHEEDDLHMDDLMSYSKVSESRIDHDRSPLRHEELQESAAKPFKGLSPTPKRHLDFENSSEISFNYSPEQSALIVDFLNNKNGESQSRKASHPNLPLPFHKLEFVWDEQKEKAFQEYCSKDFEIMKLRNKINFLKDEIALLKIQPKK